MLSILIYKTNNSKNSIVPEAHAKSMKKSEQI